MLEADSVERRADARGSVVRVATVGLVAILLGLTAATIWTSLGADRVVSRVTQVSIQRDAWVTVRVQVNLEDAAAHELAAHPDGGARAQLRDASRAVDAALGFLVRGGEPDDAADAAELRDAHDRATRELRMIVDAVEAGRPGRADELFRRRFHPTHATMEARVALAADREWGEMEGDLGGLRRRQRAQLGASLVAAAGGMVAFGVFLAMLLGSRRELARQAADSRHQALHDALTGLPNRALFADRTEQAIRAADRHLQPVALLLLDLDRFKDVNDTLGHDHGDQLLLEVGARLRGVLRELDTVARLGGDEFAMLLPATTLEGAAVAAERVLTALHQPLTLDGVALDVGASIGVAVYPDHGGDAAALRRHADVAMYAAKRAHTGYLAYDPSGDQHSPGRLALLGGLRRALDRDELVLHYQPKADLRSGRPSGVEALVRWQHPEHGLLGPMEFIPLAERTGLIHPLTAWVLDRAVRQAAAWRRDGRTLSVAVNVSTRCLLDQAFPDQVAGCLAAAGIPADMLVLEVTESAVMTDPARALDVLGRLRELGVGLSIDDFGTGYSSMAYLKALPVDELKIDRSFVAPMASSPSDAVIVRSTIDLGHNLGLRVVAEGVEDQAAWEELASLGCDTAQGYLLSRPVPAAEMERWLDGAARPEAARPLP